jgi:flagellar hook-associated protein 3 FlgL
MNLRITQNHLFGLLNSHLSEGFSRMAFLQEQVASGKRILHPSDDPTGSSLALALYARKAENQGHSDTATAARTRVDEASSLVSQANELLGSARELVIQGMSTALGGNARAILATQIDQLREQMIQLANTNFDGEYIFGGTNSTQPPFVEGGLHSQWRGNDVQRRVLVGPGDEIDTGVPGSSLFARNSPTGTTYGGTSGIRAGTSGDQGEGFENLIVRHDSTSGTLGAGITFANGGASDTFLGARALEIDGALQRVRFGNGQWFAIPDPTSAPAADFRIEDDHGAEIHLDFSGWTGADVTTNVTGAGSVSLDGTNFTAIALTETNLQLTDPSSGAIIHVDTTAVVRSGTELVTFGGTANVFDILAGIAADLRSDDGSLTNDEIAKRLGARLVELDSKHDDLLVGLGALGARSSRIADVQDRLANRNLDIESRRSLVEDVDITTAVLELTRQQQTLQLAEATGAKIIQMTLADYLR